MISHSSQLARKFIGKRVEVTINHPLGSRNAHQGYVYETNCGVVMEAKRSDGSPLNAYYLGTQKPVTRAGGIVIAFIHSPDHSDDKLVVVPDGVTLTDKEIMVLVNFQEMLFDSRVFRK